MMRNAFIAGLALLLSGAPVTACSAGGIDFVSGGIGEAEQQQLLAHEGEYNLKLVFTLMEGNYVADVKVTVKNSAGQSVVEHVAGGPFFLAKLPAGRYTVSATYEGRTVTRQVRVSEKPLRTEYLRWPSNPETDHPLPREQAAGARSSRS